MSLDAGSTILTSGAAPAAPPPDMGGNPAGGSTPVDGAQAAINGAVDGPPEYIPPKFWDPEKKSPKIEDLGKSYMSLEKLLGREKVPVPTSDDDEEGWSRWYAASGRPEKPDEYEFKRPDSLPDDLPWDEEQEKNYRTWAHANGLSKRQATNLFDKFVVGQLERHAAYQQHKQQERAQAQMIQQRKYGAQYEAKIAKGRAALQKYADAAYMRKLDETGMGNDPDLIDAWIKVGEEMAGDERLKGTAAPAPAPADLDKAISDFRTKHEKALFSKDHPDHDVRVKEYNRLFEARYGA